MINLVLIGLLCASGKNNTSMFLTVFNRCIYRFCTGNAVILLEIRQGDFLKKEKKTNKLKIKNQNNHNHKQKQINNHSFREDKGAKLNRSYRQVNVTSNNKISNYTTNAILIYSIFCFHVFIYVNIFKKNILSLKLYFKYNVIYTVIRLYECDARLQK